MAQTMSQILASLFGTYNQADNIDRQELYARLLGHVPLPLLEKAVYKVMMEWQEGWVPPPAVILKAAESIYATKYTDLKVKTWEEAWGEIDEAMRATPWDKSPKWSTPQIAAAVNAYGWQSLQTALAADMPTIRAQIRRFYEDACSRIHGEAVNDYLLGNNPMGLLGVPRKSAIEAIGNVAAALGAGK